ncbi:MAG: N-acetyltransferase [Chitinophagaceae bacterium]|nr:MAG: N-acetyltransferase [Chitinophagaceae bacterium]
MLTFNFNQFPIIHTERLLLREHSINDAGTLFKIRRNIDVMQYIHREQPQTIEEVETLITAINNGFEQRQTIAWVICLKENPSEMIGSIGYWRTNLANYRAEIGYMISPEYWRKGLVSEALRATVDFGFEEMNLHSIHGNIDPSNEASRRILVKHGFVKEGYFKEDHYFNGKFLDSEIYSLLKK